MIKQCKQQGLSLIELMIAIVIGLFLTAGLIELFISNKASSDVQEELSRIQENGRFAMQILGRDIRMADFVGCRKEGVHEANNHIDDTDANYDNATHNVSAGLVGTNGALGASTAVDAPDTLTIVNATESGIPVIAPLQTRESDDINIGTNHNISQGDIVVISDCRKADIFQVTNDSQTEGFLRHTLGGFQYLVGTQTKDAPGNKNINNSCPANPNPALNHCFPKTYDQRATVYKLSANKYEIAVGANGAPALFRNDDELVPNIENFHVLYGEDTTPDDDNYNPDYYIPAGLAGNPPNMDNVISVRIAIVARSENPNLATQPMAYTVFGDTVVPNDNYVRRVFTATLSLRNRRL